MCKGAREEKGRDLEDHCATGENWREMTFQRRGSFGKIGEVNEKGCANFVGGPECDTSWCWDVRI
jgi:hypothetical protein